MIPIMGDITEGCILCIDDDGEEILWMTSRSGERFAYPLNNRRARVLRIFLNYIRGGASDGDV